MVSCNSNDTLSRSAFASTFPAPSANPVRHHIFLLNIPSTCKNSTPIAARRRRFVAPLTSLPYRLKAPDPNCAASDGTLALERDHIFELMREQWAFNAYMSFGADYDSILSRLPSYASTPAQRAALGYMGIANYLHTRLPVDMEVMEARDDGRSTWVTRYSGPFDIDRLREDAYWFADEQLAGREDIESAAVKEVYLLTGIARDELEARCLVNEPEAMECCQFQERWIYSLAVGRGRREDFADADHALSLFSQLPFEARACSEDENLEGMAELPLSRYDADILEALPGRANNDAGEAIDIASARDMPVIAADTTPEEPSCAICCDPFVFGPGLEQPLTLLCGHTVCAECATTWFRTSPSCPYCRRRLYHRVPKTKTAGFDIYTRDNRLLQRMDWTEDGAQVQGYQFYQPFGDVEGEEGQDFLLA
ncbi:putative RING finger protein [Lasiodiplodia theobromae]|uniref:Putative RING finger protein n=1 Tax=Lasiodiplodia theobromae TaxID=45133 RepID=A0A5N5D1H9_9PEZI|nr:putative RING finger protein [Lasiodiplodia theobromae]